MRPSQGLRVSNPFVRGREQVWLLSIGFAGEANVMPLVSPEETDATINQKSD